MLPRDCVLTSIGHQVPDRLPIIIGGTAGKFYRSTTLALMAHFGIPEEKAELVQAGFKYVLHCDELMKKLGSSVLFLYPQNHSEDLLRAQNTLGGEFVNKWGSTFKFMDEDGEKPLLESNVSLKEAVLETLARHSWPKPEPFLTKGLRQRARRIHEEGTYALAVHRPLCAGIFGTCRYFLRGSEQFLCDLLVNTEFSRVLMENVLKVELAFYDSVIDEVGGYIDIIEIEDDLGMQDRLMVSPQCYREMIKPFHKRLVSHLKSRKPGLKVLMHSDGSIHEIIPDLIEAGVDILNPVQVNCKGMEMPSLKTRFGKGITFAGAVDIQEPFMGPVETVRKCTEKTIEAMAPGGGYLFGPTHNFSPNISLENILAMFEVARNFSP